MKKEVSYREKKEYMTESGQHIEEWRKIGTVEVEAGDDDFGVEEDVIYYGAATISVTKPQMVPTEQGLKMAAVQEPKEIKFSIPGAKNVEEALQMFNDAAEDMLRQLHQAQEDAQRQQQSQIVTAPEAALGELDRMKTIITD